MSLWRTYYHIVWATKKRMPLISLPVEPILYDYIQAKARSLDSPLYAIGGVTDHIHLIISIPPKLAVAQAVKSIKACSSRYINNTFPEQQFTWQREYGVFSLGGKQLPNAIAYVENQERHHDTQTLIRSLEPEIFQFARK